MSKITEIQTILENLTAFEYAQSAVDYERENYTIVMMNTGNGEVAKSKPSYEEYMRQFWHSTENPPLQECIDRSFSSSVQAYGNLCEQYNEWILNGRLFLLDTETASVYFVGKTERYGGKPSSVSMYMNYNPREIDALASSTKHEEFMERIQSGRYDVSTDEKALMDKCDEIISDTGMKMYVSKWD